MAGSPVRRRTIKLGRADGRQETNGRAGSGRASERASERTINQLPLPIGTELNSPFARARLAADIDWES